MYVNFLSTYTDKKSCHTSTTVQTSIARFVQFFLSKNFLFLLNFALVCCTGRGRRGWRTPRAFRNVGNAGPTWQGSPVVRGWNFQNGSPAVPPAAVDPCLCAAQWYHETRAIVVRTDVASAKTRLSRSIPGD